MITNAQRLYGVFANMFPSMELAVKHYGPHGKHSIRMETTAHITLIFTYDGPKSWRLETEVGDKRHPRTEHTP